MEDAFSIPFILSWWEINGFFIIKSYKTNKEAFDCALLCCKSLSWEAARKLKK